MENLSVTYPTTHNLPPCSLDDLQVSEALEAPWVKKKKLVVRSGNEQKWEMEVGHSQILLAILFNNRVWVRSAMRFPCFSRRPLYLTK